jgi:hypothetical protein
VLLSRLPSRVSGRSHRRASVKTRGRDQQGIDHRVGPNAPYGPMLYRPSRRRRYRCPSRPPMTAPRYFRTEPRFRHACRCDPSRGGRKMGEGDLLPGPHGEGGTEHRGIGIMGIGPEAPYGRPYAPWAWTTQNRLPGARPPARTCVRTCTQEEGGHRDRRTASTPAMAAAAAKNIAKKSASYAHANPRLKQDTNAIMVSSRTLASNSCPPLFREHTLALSRMSISRRQI